MPDTDVLIVGAGFAGLGMAIQLRKAGFESFLIIEKADELGGTWRENRYPGCACDVPSHLYSFSFELNPDWSRMYAPREEISAYLHACAKRHGVLPRIRFGTTLREAVWDETGGFWQVTTDEGVSIRARVLVTGMGALHAPCYPDIPGLEHFAGTAFHSSDWRSGVKLAGKNVAVIGTGASAIQIVPQIAREAGRLYLFQRTPAWVLPKVDVAIPEHWRRRFRQVPGLMRVFRMCLFCLLEMRVPVFLGSRWMQKQAEEVATRYLESKITDPKLRQQLRPTYAFGCKRVLVASDFYPALTRSNVDLVTDRIAEVRDHSIVTEDGTERSVDFIVYATGFRAAELLHGARIIGRNGQSFPEAWRESKSAFLGITMSGFPNLFLLLGPNTGLGHNSVVLMIEAQIGYVMSCLKRMRRRNCAVVELRLRSQQRFRDLLRRRLAKTVWQSGGCRSWYQDPQTGENVALWPGSVMEYRWRARKASPADYEWRGGPLDRADPAPRVKT